MQWGLLLNKNMISVEEEQMLNPFRENTGFIFSIGKCSTNLAFLLKLFV